MEKEQVLDVSWETIIKIFAAVFIFYIVYLVRNIALWFFFALVISVLLETPISFLTRMKIPKVLAAMLVYLSIFGLLGLLVYLAAPIFTSELKEFSQYLPSYFDQINPVLKQLGIDFAENFNDFSSAFVQNLQQGSKGILRALAVFFGGVASTASILTISFFLSLENKGTENLILLFAPQKYEEQIRSVFERSQRKVSAWFGARVLACSFVGVASFIVFYIFGIKYAFILALISGVLNFIPYIGPWITSILLIVFIAVSSGSWVTVLYVLASVVIIQEVENKLLTPILMKKLVDLPPVLVLISLFVGAEIYGFLGTIFAVPVFGLIYEFIKEFIDRRREDFSG